MCPAGGALRSLECYNEPMPLPLRSMRKLGGGRPCRRCKERPSLPRLGGLCAPCSRHQPRSAGVIRLAIDRHGSVASLSRESGVGRTTIYRALDGEPISGGNAQKLPRVLGVPLSLFELR